MKLHELPTFESVRDEALQDPALRAEWERTAVARAVAKWVLRYRVEHGLSQRQLAAQLGWKQPVVARLELGEREPTLGTLRQLAQKLRMEIVLDMTPGAATWLDTAKDEVTVYADARLSDGTRVAFAARPAA